MLHEVLTKISLNHAFSDDCLYITKEKSKIILMYFNNIAVATLRSMHVVSFKTVLSNNFDIADLGELKSMLGILVTHNH